MVGRRLEQAAEESIVVMVKKSLIEFLPDLSELQKRAFPLKRECCINHWIPAFAGMTVRQGLRLQDCRFVSIASLSFQRKPESTPAWTQVVERRLEQAAEEGDDGVPQETLIESETP